MSYDGIAKVQHYVPQFYLRNFTDEINMFWIFNRSTKNFNRSKPKDICREDYLYETEWKTTKNFGHISADMAIPVESLK